VSIAIRRRPAFGIVRFLTCLTRFPGHGFAWRTHREAQAVQFGLLWWHGLLCLHNARGELVEQFAWRRLTRSSCRIICSFSSSTFIPPESFGKSSQNFQNPGKDQKLKVESWTPFPRPNQQLVGRHGQITLTPLALLDLVFSDYNISQNNFYDKTNLPSLSDSCRCGQRRRVFCLFIPGNELARR
jgi:hypothetical protein